MTATAAPTPVAAPPRARPLNLNPAQWNTQLGKVLANLHEHLLPIYGPELFGLPLHIDHSPTAPPAWTNKHGIWLAARVVARDPYNAHVYLNHEIFHHVVHNHEETHRFAFKTVNYAEDYWINWHMLRLFGFDVRAVRYPGLFHEGFKDLTPAQIAAHLVRRNQNPTQRPCGCQGVAHPLITKLAERIRVQHDLGRANRQGPLIICDAVEDEDYRETLATYHRSLVGPAGVIVDLPNLATGLWHKAHQSEPHSTPVRGRLLNNQQALCYGWEPGSLRTRTENDPDASMLAVRVFFSVVSQHPRLMHERVTRAEDRLDRYREKLRTAKLVRDQKKYLKRIARTERLLPLLREATEWPIQRLLREQPAEITRQTGFSAGASSLRAHARVDPVTTPGIVRLRPGRTTRVLSWISRRAASQTHYLLDTREDLEAQLGDLLKGEPPAASPPTLPSLDDAEDDLPEEDDEGEGEPGDEADRAAPDNSDEELDLPPQEEQGEPEQAESGDGGNVAGKGNSGAGKTLSNLEIISELSAKDLNKLTNILAHMQQFETALKTRRFARVDDLASTADILPTFGNDISRVDASELALLHNPSTAMLFYSRLADHSLLLRAPMDAKRQPIAMALDASGSMSGQRYEIACGFALAMIKILKADGRGAALTIFSSVAAPSLIMRPGEAFDLRGLIVTLLRPYFGGTSFDAALGEMFKVKLNEKWKSMTAILITDGGDTLSDRMHTTISGLKEREDRLVAVITGKSGSDSGLHGLNDETLRAEKKDMQFTLTRLGNRLL